MGSGASTNMEGSIMSTQPVGHMLGKLHQMMEGEDWFNDDGWPDPLPEFGEPDFTKYFGLGINAYNDVIRISLPRNNLGGRLPFSEDFVQATMELRTINLESNLIEGGFPNAWCQYSNLTDLNLTRNGLRGTFPDAIGNLISLKKLKLGQNQFYGKLPVTLSKLTELTRLELHRNRLTSVPDMLGNLGKLHTLKMNENLFTGELPEAWVLLESIREMYIFSNHFKLFDGPKNAFSDPKARTLTEQNIKVLDVLRVRCQILVMLEEQVGDGGFISDRLPSKDVWPEQPHLFGNGFESMKLQSHEKGTLADLAEVRKEEREEPTY